MSKTLSGAYLNGYTLSGASQGVLNPVSVTGSIAIGSGLIPAALYAQGPNTWTITNQGSITGGAVDAVELAVGGTVVNYQAGFLSGHIGVAVLGSPGGVTNSGAIIALSAGTAASAYQAIGVLLSAGGGVTNQINSQITGQGAGIDILGGTGTVLNSGTIAGRAYDGVYLANGSVTNLASGVIKGGTIGSGGSIGAGGSVVTSGWGVVIRTAGTLSNQGSVTGIGQGGAFLGGGTVSNQGIIAGAWGIAMSGGTGTVINSGYLDGTVQSGVFLSGGAVTNTGTGRIVGVSGVVIRGAAGTVVNGASITATSPAGYAVYLAGGFADRVVDNPGGRFTGLVNGGNAIGAAAISTLELGSGGQTGTLSGLGTQFINFAQVTVDAGAAWSLNGPNNVATGVTLANQGSLAVNGALLVNGAMTSVGAMTVASTAGINASVTVDTAGATWNLAGELVAGNLGTANVTISNAATLAASASGSLPAMALGAGAVRIAAGHRRRFAGVPGGTVERGAGRSRRPVGPERGTSEHRQRCRARPEPRVRRGTTGRWVGQRDRDGHRVQGVQQGPLRGRRRGRRQPGDPGRRHGQHVARNWPRRVRRCGHRERGGRRRFIRRCLRQRLELAGHRTAGRGCQRLGRAADQRRRHGHRRVAGFRRYRRRRRSDQPVRHWHEPHGDRGGHGRRRRHQRAVRARRRGLHRQ